MATTPETRPTYAPRRPTLVALGLLTAFILVLFLPAFAGNLLVSPYGDQIWAGLPFRWFGAEEFHRTGSIPLWNPYMFGGLPFVGAMHGDIFYPTAWLRLVLPTDAAVNLSFAAHLVLAGWFAYLFLRTLGASWTGSVVGGLAYQLSGSVASMVQPGHDGKLYVSALLPLLLTGLVLGIRKRRLEGYALVALATAGGLLAPHLQMMQYGLIFAGLFTLWLVFRDDEGPASTSGRVRALALALAAVALGFAGGVIQLYPFLRYMPYAARVAGNQGWNYATSWAMPPENIVDWLVSDFTGMGATYWGSNFVKLNSEYLGAGTIVLAALGLLAPARRRLIRWLGGCWLLFVLVALGGHTPFYHLWYAIVPGVKVTRAAGMAFYIPTFIVACFAAFGVERLERGEGEFALKVAAVAAALLLLLGASGALARMAESLALGFGKDPIARVHGRAILVSSLRSSVVAAIVAGAGLACLKGRLRGFALALVLVALVGTDEFVNAWHYFTWSPPAAQIYADDPITTVVERTPPPYRLLDVPIGEGGSYPAAFLMAKRIPSALGHHGNELDAYDKLLGGKNEWRSVYNPRLWDLLAIRYVVYGAPLRIGGFHVVARTSCNATDAPIVTRTVCAQSGDQFLYEADSVPPYARVVPAAIKVRAEQIPATVLVAGFDPYRIVLLDSAQAERLGVNPPHIDSLPPPMSARATVTRWEPGAMTVRLDPPPERDGWLVVSENWYTEWRAWVDGRGTVPLKGQGTFLTVPVSRGSREVRFEYSRSAYRTGRSITWAAFALILAGLVVPPLWRRSSG